MGWLATLFYVYAKQSFFVHGTTSGTTIIVVKYFKAGVQVTRHHRKQLNKEIEHFIIIINITISRHAVGSN